MSARPAEFRPMRDNWGARASKDFGPFLVLGFIAAGVVGLPALVLGLLFGPAIATAVAASIGIGLAFWVASQGRLALRSMGARPAGSEAPRAAHLLHELARELSVPEPSLWISASAENNALVCNAGGPALLLTTALLEQYTRTELEAVVVHCLCRCGAKDLKRAQVASAFGGLGLRFASPIGDADDVIAASLTRYPPALASAIRKASIGSPRWAAFWFVADRAPHRPVTDRIALLADL
ncbi:MAG: hypothetical protein ABR505_06775 [Actinomycetota bacterium]